MVRQIGSGSTPLHRFRTGLEFAISGYRQVNDMMARHAGLARELGSQLGLPDAVLDALGASYERWDGRGWPGALDGDAIPMASRVVQLAEFAEVAHRVGGIDAAIALAQRRRATQFDPLSSTRFVLDAAKVFGQIDDAGSWDTVIDAEPSLAISLTAQECDDALLAIGRFVDLKSPFTIGHSLAVAELAARAGRQLGLPDDEAHTLYRAGLVHDFGRLGVELDLGQARPAGCRRMGTGAHAPLLHGANAPAITHARTTRPHRRAAPRAARRHGLPAGPERQRDLAARASSARLMRTRPCANPGRTARRPRPQARQPSCGPMCDPVGSSPTRSRPCSPPPDTASCAAARDRPG